MSLRDDGRPIRRSIGTDQSAAEYVAAEVNGQLVATAPKLFAFAPVSMAALQRSLLDYHENVLR